MLDQNLHMTLPETEVAAFFKAELRRCVSELRQSRMIERMDGSMTTEKARRNRIESLVLRGMVEDGLRQEMAPERLAGLAEEDRGLAVEIQSDLYREFLSPAFNQQARLRAQAPEDLPAADMLQLRWAAVGARAAASEAVEELPLHRAEAARNEAISLLRGLMQEAVGEVAPRIAPASMPNKPPAAPVVTEGVELIEGRMTGRSLSAQMEAARVQPEDAEFDGHAGSSVIEAARGDDIAGTAVRMVRRSNANQDTRDQKLKSVTVFMFLTGVQRMSEIRQHHLDHYSKTLAGRMPKIYWRKPEEQDLTSVELLQRAEHLGQACGLSPSTIERHMNTVAALVHHGRAEGNVTQLDPNLRGLIPEDTRSDDEKREVPTLADVQTLFRHSLWQGCKSRGRRHSPGQIVVKDHHYWINLLLVYTGARRSEIAGLLVDDLGVEEGIHFVSLRPNHLRGLKNRASKRRVPLHSHLVELGFPEFVAKARKRGDVALFPEAVPEAMRHLAHKRGEVRTAYDKKFGDVLDHMLRMSFEHSLDGNPRGLSAHGFRHYVNDHLINLRQADGSTQVVPEIDRKDLLGHQLNDTNHATYRRAEKPLGPLSAAIERLPRLF
ncbi:tyrosine-type recombinase/integrase (plasmid) [Thioclava litoralis]|uniref:Tyrosine-type recombinase/integrase n=1 Tax=Thioclava litoralis TaxID=3076557 RepID=A0ABZ1E5Y1_9RHOB|nr:tyrosine-type recombinase/integrase [Thioclava sp. FTW29]